jgi:tetratricopeptide (TPR) repeat protein
VLAEKRYAEVRQLAKGLVFKYHDQIANLPGSTATREALLTDAVRYLDGLSSDGALDPALAREVAESYLRVSVLQGEQYSPSQERLAAAAANLDKALALLPRYIDRRDVTLEALHGAIDMWLARSSQSARTARLADSLSALERARALAEQARARAPDDLQSLSRLATIEGRIGTVLGGSAVSANLGLNAQAMLHLQRSDELMSQLRARQPEVAEWAHQRGWSCTNLASALTLVGRFAEGVSAGRCAVAMRDEAAAHEPGNAHYQHQRSTARIILAYSLAYAGQGDLAVATHEQAVAMARATVVADPANKAAVRDVLLSDVALARILVLARRRDAARPLLEGGLRDLPEAEDADFYLRRLHAETLLWLVRALPPAEAARALELAGAAAALMVPPDGARDDNAPRAWAYAMAVGEQAVALSALGRRDESRARAAAALAAWRAAPGDGVPAMLSGWVERDRRLAAP